MDKLAKLLKQVESVPDFVDHTITDVNYRNSYGDTPLHIVSNWGNCEAIAILVSSGADINSKGESGFTPLHCAVEQNHPPAVLKLLELGAKLVSNANGETPLELAISLNNKEVVSVLKQ